MSTSWRPRRALWGGCPAQPPPGCWGPATRQGSASSTPTDVGRAPQLQGAQSLGLVCPRRSARGPRPPVWTAVRRVSTPSLPRGCGPRTWWPNTGDSGDSGGRLGDKSLFGQTKRWLPRPARRVPARPAEPCARLVAGRPLLCPGPTGTAWRPAGWTEAGQGRPWTCGCRSACGAKPGGRLWGA